jgi:hypothetical protein
VRTSFGLSGFADHVLALSTRRERSGSFTQLLCLFGKTLFKGVGMFETASLHVATPPLLAGAQRFSNRSPRPETSLHAISVRD